MEYSRLNIDERIPAEHAMAVGESTRTSRPCRLVQDSDFPLPRPRLLKQQASLVSHSPGTCISGTSLQGRAAFLLETSCKGSTARSRRKLVKAENVLHSNTRQSLYVRHRSFPGKGKREARDARNSLRAHLEGSTVSAISFPLSWVRELEYQKTLCMLHDYAIFLGIAFSS